MGAPMARRLQLAGHQVYAWNRTADKLNPLLVDGVKRAESAVDAIATSQLIILMLTDAEDKEFSLQEIILNLVQSERFQIK